MEKINTFVVPHYNNKNLRKTLESIRRNTPPNFYIILVDQNVEYQKVDDLVDIHIRVDRQLGFAKASNMGFRLAETKYVSIWNDDCECINQKWWEGIEKTFADNPTALGVNPSSPRNPGGPGGDCVEAVPYQADFSDADYQKLLDEIGHGWVIDGICTYATVFDTTKLSKLKGHVPGVLYDEFFWPGGGEDYDLDRRAYMSGMRMLGTGHSFVWHWWYGSNDGKVNFSYGFEDKWKQEGSDAPDIYGNGGQKYVLSNTVRPLEDCPKR